MELRRPLLLQPISQALHERSSGSCRSLVGHFWRTAEGSLRGVYGVLLGGLHLGFVLFQGRLARRCKVASGLGEIVAHPLAEPFKDVAESDQQVVAHHLEDVEHITERL